MQEIIDKIAAEVGIDPALAEKATSMITNFIATQAPAQYVDQIKQYVPGFDQLVAQGAANSDAAQTAGGGGLMGALGGLMGGLMGGSGGAMASAMAMLRNLEKDGLGLGQVKQIATSLIGELRRVAGDEAVDKLIAELPGAGHLLG